MREEDRVNLLKVMFSECVMYVREIDQHELLRLIRAVETAGFTSANTRTDYENTLHRMLAMARDGSLSSKLISGRNAKPAQGPGMAAFGSFLRC